MKKAVLALSLLFSSAAIFAQATAPVQKKAEDVIKFKEMTYNFGKIKQNVPVTHDFLFTNSSEQPVVIESATASCGCTTPVHPQGAVGINKTDKITAGFNAATIGTFSKPITVKVAGVDIPVVLTITGEVLTAEDYAKYEATVKKPNGRPAGR